jgi:hypothetical protein
MLDFDPDRTWRPVQEKLDQTTNPRHRQLLAEVLAHGQGEVRGDLDMVMGTLAPTPVYRYVRQGASEPIVGTEAVRDYYVNETFGGGNHILEGNKDRIVVDDHTVITEGTMRILKWGRDLAAQGAPIDDVDATYLLSVRLLIVWPFDDDGKLVGEESWSQPATRELEKIDDADVPAAFRDYIAKKAAAIGLRA